MAEAVKQELLQRKEEVEEQVSSTATTMAGSQKNIFSQLCEDLQPLAAQWKALATQLKISAAEQHEIEGEKSRCQNCLQRVLQEWLETEGPHTKAFLVDVLKKRVLGQNRLAAEISRDEDVPDDLDKDKEESLKILTARLSRKIAHKYRPFGIQLLNDPDTISDIELRVKNVQNYLSETLTRWSNKQEGDLPLQEVLDAIRSPAIGNPKLAKELEEDWTKNGFLPAPAEAMEDDKLDFN